MKYLLMLCTLLLPSAALAETIHSLPENADISRIAGFYPLLDKPGLTVQAVVIDQGGSTDASPMQMLYLTLYSKGEICSTGASFNLGPVFSVQGAKRIEAGIYEIRTQAPDNGIENQKDMIFRVDARQATAGIQKAPCEEEFFHGGHYDAQVILTKKTIN